MKLSIITDYLEQLYPLNYAEPWDYPGLIWGDFEAEITNFVLAIDPVMPVVDYIQQSQLNNGLLITHHPLFFRAVNKVGGDTFRGKFLNQLAMNNFALYNAHTNADVAINGVCTALADLLELKDTVPLVPLNNQMADRKELEGHGRVGKLSKSCTLEQLAHHIADVLLVPNVQVSGNLHREITTVAVLGGAGDSFFDAVEASGADVYITSDLRHHPVLDAKFERNFALINTSHFASEFPWLYLLKEQLERRFGCDLPIQIFATPTDPWDLVINSTN